MNYLESREKFSETPRWMIPFTETVQYIYIYICKRKIQKFLFQLSSSISKLKSMILLIPIYMKPRLNSGDGKSTSNFASRKKTWSRESWKKRRRGKDRDVRDVGVSLISSERRERERVKRKIRNWRYWLRNKLTFFLSVEFGKTVKNDLLEINWRVEIYIRVFP